MRYVLALDQGTTSSRAILFDENGRPVETAQREFRQIFPQPGWVEHDAKEIYETQRDTAREVLRKTEVALKDVMGIGITNQRETTIIWDRQTGEPIHNAIVWQDRRTAPQCAELKKMGAESLVRERTGLVIDPYFSGTKIAWLLDNVRGARGRAERGELAFGTVDTWLTWHLTGNRTHVTDVVERVAHPALQHPHQRLGPRAAAAAATCRARCCPTSIRRRTRSAWCPRGCSASRW